MAHRATNDTGKRSGFAVAASSRMGFHASASARGALALLALLVLIAAVVAAVPAAAAAGTNVDRALQAEKQWPSGHNEAFGPSNADGAATPSPSTPLRTFHAARKANNDAARIGLPHAQQLFALMEGDKAHNDDGVISNDQQRLRSPVWLDSESSSSSSSGVGGPSPAHSFHTPMQFDTIRDSMLDSKWMDDTKQSSANAMAFLRNFPRKKMDGSSGTNQLQRLDGPFNRSAANAAEEDPILDYIAGMFFMYGVPLFFAMLAIVVWAGFCVARCWCNLCGRHATVLYSDKQVRINYLLVVLLIIIMGVCAAFGWTGNVQVSQGVDRGFDAAKGFADYGYEFMGVTSTAYGIADNALRLGASFNATMGLVPGEGVLNASQSCVQDAHLVLGEQGDLVASMRALRSLFTGDSDDVLALDRAAEGVDAVADAMERLASPISTTPPGGTASNSALRNLDQQLTALQTSLDDPASVPDAATIDSIISDLAQVQSWSKTVTSPPGGVGATTTLAALQALSEQFASMHSAAHAVSPVLASRFSAHLDTIENGVAALGMLTRAIQLVSRVEAPEPADAAADAAELEASFQSILDSFASSMPPDFPSVLQSFQDLREGLASINASLPLIRSGIASYRSTSTGLLSHWPSNPADSVYLDLKNELGLVHAFQQAHGASLAHVLVTDMPALILALQRVRSTTGPALDSFARTRALVQKVSDATLDFVSLTDAIHSFNQSSPRLPCFLDVLTLFEEVNSTLVILPTALNAIHERLGGEGGALELQVAPESAQAIRAGLDASLEQLRAVEASLGTGGQPDYDALATALLGLNDTLASVPSFHPLWSELLPLSHALSGVSGVDLVEALYADPVWSTEGDLSYPTAMWGDVERVSLARSSILARGVGAGAPPSALAALVDLPDSLHMNSSLTSLESLVDALEAHLGSSGLNAALLEQHALSLASFAEAAAALPPLLRAVLPLLNTTTTPSPLPLPTETSEPLLASLESLSSAVSSRPDAALMASLLGSDSGPASGLQASLGTVSAQSDRQAIATSLESLQSALASLPSLPSALRSLHSNLTSTFPELHSTLAPPLSQMLVLQQALDPGSSPLASVPGENSLFQSMHTGYSMTGPASLVSSLDPPGASASGALSLSLADHDVLHSGLELFRSFTSHFPDFDSKLSQGHSGLLAIRGALDYMEETWQDYNRISKDFKSTMDNYDGVRLLIFNLGVIFPFILSFFLLLAAIQHYGCPAMVAGLTFFPLFVLFMCMSAIQMPVSVALSDHCYNSTGAIKIQMEGRSYPAAKLAFFDLQSDIDVPSVVDYFTECIGEPPELLVKLQNPLPILHAQGLNSSEIQLRAREGLGVDFAEPLVADFRRLDRLIDDTVNMFNTTVSKLNCVRSSSLYHTAMDAICTDFGPAFALTTCVFLLTGVCMVPGICIGVTSYKRFNPLNRDAAYTRAKGSEDDHVINDPAVPEGWN